MQLTLQLDATSRRPVVKLDWFNGCRALLDTGALFPVWTSDGKLLQQLGAKLEKQSASNPKISYVAHCADRRRRSGAQTSATEVERSRTGRRSVRAQWRTPPEGEVWV